MTEPHWLTMPRAGFIHEAVIAMGGGAYGLRDMALLQSALARPQNHDAYGVTDVFQLAASCAEAVSRNHAFVDGNKRTAFYVAVDFLEQNGSLLKPAVGVEHAEMMEQLGQGLLDRDKVAAHFETYSESL